MGSPCRGGAARLTVWVSWEDGPGRSGPASLSAFPFLLLDVAAVCEACCDLMGEAGPAAPDYPLHSPIVLVAWLRRAEHDRSTVLPVQPFRPWPSRMGYRRLPPADCPTRVSPPVECVAGCGPAELTPIDYDPARDRADLWFAEGVTKLFSISSSPAGGR